MFESFTYLILFLVSFNYTLPLNGQSSFEGDNKFSSDEAGLQEDNVRVEKFIHKSESFDANFDISSKPPAKSIPTVFNLTDEDLRQYEQLVILKKYPYLDLNHFRGKNELDTSNERGNPKDVNNAKVTDIRCLRDPSACNPSEYGPHVEVLNRGLSGFEIPSLQLRLDESKQGEVWKPNTESPNETCHSSLIDSLRKFLIDYESKRYQIPKGK